ncbi:hypothetical protein J3T99_05445 [Acetobacteraceae bacterium B3987]|nr:hypothetical protein [Acetobacteraceae bacterium B3987]
MSFNAPAWRIQESCARSTAPNARIVSVVPSRETEPHQQAQRGWALRQLSGVRGYRTLRPQPD